ncbi:MAG: hypothetical protein LBC39_01265 [Methanobrevibacter sp.]|jgi:hypothetical protein|nr:hypothetical protein [Candidatus Methanovirga aequatorialis]
MNIKEKFLNEDDSINYLKAFGGCCGLIIILGILLLAIGSLNNHNSTNTTTTSTNTNSNNNVKTAVEFSDVNVFTGDYGNIKVTGKFKFTDKDHGYVSFGAQVHLKDGTTTSESIIQNFNNIHKGTIYNLEGSLMTTNLNKFDGNGVSLSDIESIDITDNNKVVYTWKNE